MILPFLLLATTPVVAPAEVASAAQAAEKDDAPIREAGAGEIADAAFLCMTASLDGGVSEELLAGGGWKRAAVTVTADAPRPPVVLYASESNRAAIALRGKLRSNPDHYPGCVVMAKLAAVSDFAAVADAIEARMGPAHQEDAGRRRWFVEGRIVSLKLTGSETEPSVRVATLKIPEEKK